MREFHRAFLAVPLVVRDEVYGSLAFYVSDNGSYPIPNIRYWNLVIGFSLMISGFLMTTRWR
jgi:hypothetical protein